MASKLFTEYWYKVFNDLTRSVFTIRPDQDGLGLVELIHSFEGKEESRMTFDPEEADTVGQKLIEMANSLKETK